MRKIILFIFCVFAMFGAYANGDTTARINGGSLGSRFYFPNSVGMSVPFSNTHTTLRNGLSLSTSVEYRIHNGNSFYFKLDYDVLNDNYTTLVHNLPTNIIQGKLASDFIIAGAGYRRRFDRWGVYAALQPGLGMRSFDRATINTNGVIITRATNDNFAGKTGLGLEYYIKSHFDVFFEPSYYKFFSHSGFSASHSQFTGFNIGISTARF